LKRLYFIFLFCIYNLQGILMSNLRTFNGKRKQHRGDSSRKRHSAQNTGNRATFGKKRKFSSRRGGYHESRQEEVSFFGDSFVRLFSLVKNRGLRVRAYKGATAKGLTKGDNSNRKDILKQLRRRPNTTRAVFVFGNVDVQMSYYFCKYARSPPEMIDFDAIAKDYVDFVASLPISEAIVVGVYPSPLVDDEVVASLGNYGILNDDQQATVEAADVLLNARQTRVQYFNSRLAFYCAQRGVTYVDLFNEMTDETNALKPQYRDISSRNIHVVWETTLLLWLEKFPWLRSRTPRGFIQSLQKSMDDYFVEKRDRVTKRADGGFSWAKKSHIASRVGIATIHEQNVAAQKSTEHSKEKKDFSTDIVSSSNSLSVDYMEEDVSPFWHGHSRVGS